MITDKGIIIATFDDVIADTTYEEYSHFCKNYSYYGKFLDLYHLKTKNEIYAREDKNLIKYLLDESYFNGLTAYEKTGAINNLYTTLFKYFYNVKDVYNIKCLSKLATKGLANKALRMNERMQPIIIIVKYRTLVDKDNKIKLIRYLFKDECDIHAIKENESYYDEIKKIDKWNLVITDDIDCIENLSSGDIDHREFLVPQYGYTKASPELLELIKQKNGNISYYNP